VEEHRTTDTHWPANRRLKWPKGLKKPKASVAAAIEDIQQPWKRSSKSAQGALGAMTPITVEGSSVQLFADVRFLRVSKGVSAKPPVLLRRV